MKNILEYKGYYSKVEYSAEDGVLFGKIEGINDLVTFESESATEIESEFKAAVDDYLETCKAQGKIPDKAYRGLFNVRISSELHKRLANIAISEDVTLNEVVVRAIEAFVNPDNFSVMSKIIATRLMNAYGEQSVYNTVGKISD